MLTQADIIIRLLVAAGLAGLLGFERERSGKVAGLRTHITVSLGAALLSLISIYLFENFPSIGGEQGFDYHLIANIIVGIGFIGGGAILRDGLNVSGITTAASLWVVAAVGIASGVGFYFGALVASLIVYLILATLKYVGHKISPHSK